MPDYKTGHVKHDPVTGAIAIRTVFPEVGALANHAWLVATTDSGAITKISADVESWTDIPLPISPLEVIDAEVIPELTALPAL